MCPDCAGLDPLSSCVSWGSVGPFQVHCYHVATTGDPVDVFDLRAMRGSTMYGRTANELKAVCHTQDLKIDWGKVKLSQCGFTHFSHVHKASPSNA